MGARYNSTGGSVYFGAMSASATPDVQISAAGGGSILNITNGGYVGIGTTYPPDSPLFIGTVPGIITNSLVVHLTRPGIADNVLIYASDAYGPNGASATMKIGAISATNRSINATGTINALGTDFAEYIMNSASLSGIKINKGEIYGIDGNGTLTNVYSDVIRFVIVSTSPSFVGGDNWNSAVGNFEQKSPASSPVEEPSIIAFCGRVPINKYQLYYPNGGDYTTPINCYIVPISKNDVTINNYIPYVSSDVSRSTDYNIFGLIKKQNELSLSEYINSIGMIFSINQITGNPIVIVKVV